jgi:hypothetical protein
LPSPSRSRRCRPSDALAIEPESHVFETASCREVQDRARATARAFEWEFRGDPAAARRERRAGLQLALEWLVLLAVSLGLICGPPSLSAKALRLVPWSLYAALAFDDPDMHWVHLLARQARSAPVYARQAAPRSQLLDSTSIGDPSPFASVLRVLRKRRFEGDAP